MVRGEGRRLARQTRFAHAGLAGERERASVRGRGSRERLTPVLTTALAAAFALLPLLGGAEPAGKEILHPVAVVVFGGLISATLLTLFVLPALYARFGGEARPVAVGPALVGKVEPAAE